MIESGRGRAHLPAVDGIKADIRDWQLVAQTCLHHHSCSELEHFSKLPRRK